LCVAFAVKAKNMTPTERKNVLNRSINIDD
jgi:hypothetical protein